MLCIVLQVSLHFLWDTLQLNLVMEKPANFYDFKHHIPTIPPKIKTDFNTILLIRDGRDTLVSNWHYWKIKGASPGYNMYHVLRHSSFEQFVRGDIHPDKKQLIGHPLKDHTTDPILHWAKFARLKDKIYTVRYEDLKLKPKETIIGISEHFQIPLKYKEPKPLKSLVGIYPRKGIIGDWKNNFTDELAEYFWDKVGEEMKMYGYMPFINKVHMQKWLEREMK